MKQNSNSTEIGTRRGGHDEIEEEQEGMTRDLLDNTNEHIVSRTTRRRRQRRPIQQKFQRYTSPDERGLMNHQKLKQFLGDYNSNQPPSISYKNTTKFRKIPESEDHTAACLQFVLDKGSYATMLCRELVNCNH
mmetsp:Transcript_23326/g.37488  ORF Transcript_23326/g.37488 Transcript_23326/m.37488 type:complete len:134 (+) Transcript_23326:1918-2319(+)